jgi:ABC-type transport system involved in multi-copper enzyme maturation permease subunit
MVRVIAGFEFRQRFRRISTYVYFLLLFIPAFWFTLISAGAFSSPGVNFGMGGRMLANSPYVVASLIYSISSWGIIITAALAGQATYQDVDSGSTPFFFTAPISKFDYLAGRFLGCLAVQLIIFSSIGLASWIALHTRWVDPHFIGPNRFVIYIEPYCMFVLPNLLVSTAVFFALGALTRKILPVYIGGVLFLIGYFVAVILAGDVSNSVVASLVDPYGANALDFIERYWTPFQRNTRLPPFTGLLALNRFLWLAVGFLAFVFTYWRYKMAHIAEGGRGKHKQEPAEEVPLPAQGVAFPVAHLTFSLRTSLTHLFSLTRLQLSETVKNVFFGVLVLAGYGYALIVSYNNLGPHKTPIYPVTYLVLEFVARGFRIFNLVILTFYAGDLVWRERDAGISQMVDALPVPRWVIYGSKLAALMVLQIILELVVMAAGLTVQIALGYHRFQFGLYFKELFINQLLIFWVLCVFTLAVHAIVNNKYLGHVVVILYYIAVIFLLPGMDWENQLYRFGQLPDFQYSDMNGYGPFVSPLLWMHLYWGLAAVMLAIMTNMFWVVGIDAGWRQRIALAFQRLSRPSAIAFSAATLLFVAVGAWIFYNTHILNEYITSQQFEERQAEYEKTYRKYLGTPQPKITDMKLQVDLFPQQQKMNFAGTVWLENKTGKNIDEIAVTVWPYLLAPPVHHLIKVEIGKLEFSGGQTLVSRDEKLGFYIYRLPAPLPPHGRIALEFALKYAFRGFANSREQTYLAGNGTQVNDNFLPRIGYQHPIELIDPNTRRKHGLPPLPDLPKPEDVAARQKIYFQDDADWVNWETTISTSPDQIAIAPGYLEKEWVENGRRYFHYKTDAPILWGISINSARYQVMRDRWHDVNLEIYYDPQHTFNLNRMMSGMKATLDYCTQNFSPFQFHQLRIIEFPRYQVFAESFANTIPYSEGIGFITRVNVRNPAATDLPFFGTAHEVAHQWWGHQVATANTEGATFPLEGLAQYTALMVMKHHVAPESMRKFLRVELDGYLAGRSQEKNEERPLVRDTDKQAYIHYQKGGMVMYALQDYIGEDKVSQGLAAFVKDYGLKGPPFPTSLDLENHLKKVTPPQYQYLYDDLFDNITLYENRAKSASYTKLPNGKYQVNLNVELKKFRADGRGEEHQIPAHDWVDIGVTAADGHYLYLQKHKIDGDSAQISVVVDQPPYKAGIDPLNILIDRKPDDNLVRVSRK